MKPDPAPTSIDRAIGLGPGSNRQTRPSAAPAVAQTEPAPTAMPSSSFEPDSIVWPGRFVRGLIRVTEFPSTNHTPSFPAAIRARLRP